MKKANQLYSKGEFEQAIEIYEKVVNSGFESGEIYYNLGNSCYRSNKFTDAIYYFEKAKKLIPNNVDLKHNMELANLQIYDKITPLPKFAIVKWFRELITSRSADFWASTSLISFIGLLIFLLIYFFTKKGGVKQATFFAAAVLLILSGTTFIFSEKQFSNLNSEKSAIIFNSSVFVKSSPDENATELFTIHEGLKVEIRDYSGDWCEIILADGKIGWMRKSGLKKI